MTERHTVLKDVAMVMLNITIWSGAKKLLPSDFINVDVEDLPSERVASFGSKRLIDKERLAPFASIRGYAERTCLRYGTRFLGGFAIPQDSVKQVSNELKRYFQQFQDELDKFMAEYDHATDEWIAANPDFSEVLRRSILTSNEVRTRFKASYSIFEIDAHPSDTCDTMASAQTDLMNSVLLGLVSSMKPYQNASADNGPLRASYRRLVSDAADRMRRFAFVDPSGGMVAFANELTTLVQGEGQIEAPVSTEVCKVITTFSSRDVLAAEIASRSSNAPKQSGAPAQIQPPDDLPFTDDDDMGFEVPDLDLSSPGNKGEVSDHPQQSMPDLFDPTPAAMPTTEPEPFNAVFDW